MSDEPTTQEPTQEPAEGAPSPEPSHGVAPAHTPVAPDPAIESDITAPDDAEVADLANDEAEETETEETGAEETEA